MFMPMLADKFSLIKRIAGGLTILSVMLILLLILAIIAPNSTGYTISFILNFLIGGFQSIASNSMIALAAQEKESLNMLYWLSTGLSGLLMASLSIILNSAFGSLKQGELDSTIVFFIVSTAISFTAIGMTVVYVKKKNIFQKNQTQDKLQSFEDLQDTNLNNSQIYDNQKQQVQQENQCNSENEVPKSNNSMNSENSLQESVKFQLVPFLKYVFNGMLYGLCTSALMSLGPKCGKGDIKIIETIGFIGGFCLSCGIGIGSLLALTIDTQPQIIYYYE